MSHVLIDFKRFRHSILSSLTLLLSHSRLDMAYWLSNYIGWWYGYFIFIENIDRFKMVQWSGSSRYLRLSLRHTIGLRTSGMFLLFLQFHHKCNKFNVGGVTIVNKPLWQVSPQAEFNQFLQHAKCNRTTNVEVTSQNVEIPTTDSVGGVIGESGVTLTGKRSCPCWVITIWGKSSKINWFKLPLISLRANPV